MNRPIVAYLTFFLTVILIFLIVGIGRRQQAILDAENANVQILNQIEEAIRRQEANRPRPAHPWGPVEKKNKKKQIVGCATGFAILSWY